MSIKLLLCSQPLLFVVANPLYPPASGVKGRWKEGQRSALLSVVKITMYVASVVGEWNMRMEH
jgi:hypothetical protein